MTCSKYTVVIKLDVRVCRPSNKGKVSILFWKMRRKVDAVGQKEKQEKKISGLDVNQQVSQPASALYGGRLWYGPGDDYVRPSKIFITKMQGKKWRI